MALNNREQVEIFNATEKDQMIEAAFRSVERACLAKDGAGNQNAAAQDKMRLRILTKNIKNLRAVNG